MRWKGPAGPNRCLVTNANLVDRRWHPRSTAGAAPTYTVGVPGGHRPAAGPSEATLPLPPSCPPAEPRPLPQPKAIWLAAAAVILVASGPFLLGRGVDVPDDALFATVSVWEWCRHAVTHGLNPFWVPSKLGGVSLFTEATQMGPIYPGMWLAWLLPVHFALPLSCLLHCIGAVLALRWAALQYGVRPPLATLAGAAVAAGPVGLAAFVEVQTDIWPIILWFPLIFGAHRRIELALDRRDRLRWMVAGGLALGFMLMGSHIRHVAAACGALGVLFLLTPRRLPFAVGTTVIGLLIGSVAIVPSLIEWRVEAQVADGISAMGLPPLQTLGWTFAASWAAARPFVTSREFSVGVLLALGFAAGARSRAARPLAIQVGVLLLAAAGLPGVRWLLAPLTVLAHPTLIVYYALAMVPAAIVGALGVQALADQPRLRRHPATLALVALVLGSNLARFTIGADDFGSDYERLLTCVVAAQAALVAGLGALLLRLPRERRTQALALLGLLDLGVLGVLYHLAVPALPLHLAARLHVDGEEALRNGYLHVEELQAMALDGLEPAQGLQGALESGQLSRGELGFEDFAFEGEVQDIRAEAPELQRRLLERRWPIHLACARGWPALSGRVKLPPARQLGAASPLARMLGGTPDPWMANAPMSGDLPDLAQLFGPDGLGTATLRLFGIPVAIKESGEQFAVDGVTPRCFSPRQLDLSSPGRGQLELALRPSFDARQVSTVEVGYDDSVPLTVAEASCEPLGTTVHARAPGRAFVGLRVPLHGGWTVTDNGVRADLYAVNHVHTGVFVEPGEHELRWRFRPPGLLSAGLASLLTLALAAGALVRLRP